MTALCRYAAITETYSFGVPVEIGKIDQELKKLWQTAKAQ